MKRKSTKVLSILMACVLTVYLLPLQVMAANRKQSQQDALTQQSLLGESSSKTKEASIVEEIVEKRSEFQKEYLLDNGQHMISVYPEAVHYQ